jgi:glycosyl transferase family protein
VFLTDKGGYNTTAGVRAGLVDLYLLASSQHLIGASFSSFVEMAVFLCDGAVPFERPDQPLEGEFSLSLGLAEDPLRPAQR